MLDNRHRIIALRELFQGTIDGASVHPRVVVQQALEMNAAALILFHNHTSGVAEPSHADEAITRRLKDWHWLRCVYWTISWYPPANLSLLRNGDCSDIHFFATIPAGETSSSLAGKEV